MDKGRAETLKSIERFIKVASARFDIERVILFGSHATGHPRRWSDIDIAVISNDFAGMSHKERSRILSKLAWESEATEVDALGYTEDEFAVDDALSLVSEIQEHGVVVYEKSS